MILHGTVDHSGVYAELAGTLNLAGVAVFASDMRGWGLSDGEPLYFSDLDTFVADVKADYDRIRASQGYEHIPCFLLGKSLGGLISAYVAARSVHELPLPHCPVTESLAHTPVSAAAPSGIQARASEPAVISTNYSAQPKP